MKRSFIRILNGTGWARPLVAIFLAFANAAFSEERFTFEKAEMGLPVRVTLYASDEKVASAAADAAFARIAVLNAIFTDYDSDSELCRLSDTSGGGKAVPVSPELWHVLEYARRLSQRSNGAFDMSIGPVVNLWRTARRKKELPSPERLKEALSRSGYDGMRLDCEHRTVELTKPRMRLDAGGIAKGYAMEEALSVLKKNGFPMAMVAGGGDMALGDAPPGQVGWNVEIIALDADGAPAPVLLRLSNCFVSTSGDLYQRLEIAGKRYSHIVDPRTGIGLTDHSLVTVIAERGMEADALSKVVAVLGAEAGFPVIDETPGAACRVVRAPGGAVEVRQSSRWERLVEVSK